MTHTSLVPGYDIDIKMRRVLLGEAYGARRSSIFGAPCGASSRQISCQWPLSRGFHTRRGMLRSCLLGLGPHLTGVVLYVPSRVSRIFF